jgi:AcrR family transcriptional regulator
MTFRSLLRWLQYVEIMATVNSQGKDAMPTPAHTSLDEIVRAGRSILEEEGLAGLTMQRVAVAVGVRAPSLYKRLRHRGHLVRLIADDAARELTEVIDAAASGRKPRRNVRRMAQAFRSFAHAQPAAYGLLFARLPEDSRVDPELVERSSAALLATMRELAGPDVALEAARTFVAWAHGFISMELAGAFRLGGDVDRAYEYGVERLIEAIGAKRPA